MIYYKSPTSTHLPLINSLQQSERWMLCMHLTKGNHLSIYLSAKQSRTVFEFAECDIFYKNCTATAAGQINQYISVFSGKKRSLATDCKYRSPSWYQSSVIRSENQSNCSRNFVINDRAVSIWTRDLRNLSGKSDSNAVLRIIQEFWSRNNSKMWILILND